MNEFKKRVHALKNKSPYFPEFIAARFDDNYIFLSTIVRVEKNGKWYRVHCVESFYPTPTANEATCLALLTKSAYKIRYLYNIHEEIDELDTLQISEKERLMAEMADELSFGELSKMLMTGVDGGVGLKI